MQSERTGIENKWYALKGPTVELKVEEDGDLHIALHDVTGDKPGVVGCEIPAQPQERPNEVIVQCEGKGVLGPLFAERESGARIYGLA